MKPLDLTLVCHASTRAVRETAFPRDEPLDPGGRRQAAAMAPDLRRAGLAWAGPELRTRETAEALGLDAAVDGALRDIDYGAWSGRSLSDVAASHPAETALWMDDPSAAPHGGESVSGLLDRVSGWLDAVQEHRGRATAVGHASVLRAAVIAVLRADPRSFWRIDIPPLGHVRLRSSAGRWTLVSCGR